MNRRAAGFTLIEMLIAVAILAVLAGLGWRGLDSLARARDDARQRLDAAARLGTSLRQLGDDLAAARDEGPDLPAVSRGARGDLLILRRVPQPLGDDLRAWPAAAVPTDAGALQVVRWGLRDGAWLRWVGPPATVRAPLVDAMVTARGTPQAMLDGVRDVALLVYRHAGAGVQNQSGAWVNPYTSADAGGNAAQGASLRTPAGVRVTLSLAQPTLRGEVMREFLLENRE